MSVPSSNKLHIISQFLVALAQVPDLQQETCEVDPSVDPLCPSRSDASLRLTIGKKSVRLFLYVRKATYPRDVREVLWNFHKNSNAKSTEIHHVIVSEAISSGAKELLKSERVGYFDSGGSLFLPMPGAYILIDKPAPKAHAKVMNSIFSGRRAFVLHALLLYKDRWFRVNDLAAITGIAPSTASDVLTELERLDWVESRGLGPKKERHLAKPSELLNAWTNEITDFSQPTQQRYYVPGKKSETLLQHLAETFKAHGVDYAVGYEAAAQRYAPFLSAISQTRVHATPSQPLEAALAALGARSVTEGANLTIVNAKSSGDLLFRIEVDGVWLASPIQVYLDLARSEGRAKEMAEHLRRERIGF